MTFVYVDNENFNDELSSYNCQSSCDPAPLQILPCDEVPGVSEYVEVSSAQARRYKLTRKRRATSPIDFIYANDTAYQQSINKTMFVCFMSLTNFAFL
ncbi:unnamed protein product [Anisakis simplex]|uniref:Enhancer of polycomb-like protein n=1 Tax=Anisakis simplex TaxID=6269 RepID=A0A0M3JCY8_ANISI|nr:unnamed protein product [Anisakis simplex]